MHKLPQDGFGACLRESDGCMDDGDSPPGTNMYPTWGKKEENLTQNNRLVGDMLEKPVRVS